MITKFVGMKELRQNMAKHSADALRKKHRLIVLKKNQPVFELRPLTSADVASWRFDIELKDARAAARVEKTYSTKEVREILGL